MTVNKVRVYPKISQVTLVRYFDGIPQSLKAPRKQCITTLNMYLCVICYPFVLVRSYGVPIMIVSRTPSHFP